MSTIRSKEYLWKHLSGKGSQSKMDGSCKKSVMSKDNVVILLFWLTCILHILNMLSNIEGSFAYVMVANTMFFMVLW